MPPAASCWWPPPSGTSGPEPPGLPRLAEADLVVCEDTRRTGRLLAAAGIGRRPLLAVHDHNEARSVGRVLDRVRAGEVVAVVTDAGLPGISDPGERLVRAAAEEGLEVSVVPGRRRRWPPWS